MTYSGISSNKFQSNMKSSRKTKMTFSNAYVNSKIDIYGDKRKKSNIEFSDLYKKMYPDEENENKKATEYMDLDELVDIELPNE